MNNTWNVTLMCYSCHTEFTLNGVAGVEIPIKADYTPCPHCGADGAMKVLPTPKRHLIVSLLREES